MRCKVGAKRRQLESQAVYRQSRDEGADESQEGASAESAARSAATEELKQRLPPV